MNIIRPSTRNRAASDPPGRPRAKCHHIALALRSGVPWFLALVVSIVLVVPISFARRAFGITPGSSVYLETASAIPYGGGGSTNYFWVDGQVAYCSNPQAWTPYSGWYTKSNLELPSSNADWTVEDVRTILWFGYGGPGFDRSMWPQTDWDGSTVTDAELQAYTHILVADRMWCDGGRALFGCSQAFKQWYAPNFLGYAWSGGPAPSDPAGHVAAKMSARQDEVPDQDEFDVYMIDTGYNANIGTGERSQTIVTFVYHPKVTITFTKTSSNATVSDGNASYAYTGAVYEIRTAADDALVATITTDDEGRAQLRLQPDTAYYAIEKQAPQGFVANPDRIPFNTGDGAYVNLPDAPGTVTLTICKTDAATGGEAQPGLSLEGAVFTVVDANGVSHEATTDAQGRASVEGLPLGTCTVTEKAAPEGYRVIQGTQTYTVEAGELPESGVFELEVSDGYAEMPVAFDLDIVKYHDSGAEGSGVQHPTAGVQFQIISETTDEVIATLTTDDAGRASTEGAWYGTGEAPEGIGGALPYDRAGYIVREVAETTPDGYQTAPDWHITPEEMVDGATLHYIVDNDFVGSRIQIVKTDAETGEVLPVAGFTFQLLDKDKRPVTQEVWYPNHQELSAFTTDDSGMVTLAQALVPGTYYLREVASVPPYLAEDEDILVNLPDDASVPTVTVINVPDHQAMGMATIVKTCSEHDGGTGSCAGKLAGAEFDVMAQEDVVGIDGRLLACVGEVVDHVTTDDEGRARTGKLYLGSGAASYAFVETKAPAGHALDTTPHPFTLTYADAHTPLVTAEVSASNEPTTILTEKTDAQTGEPLGEARFALWRADDEISAEPQPGKAALTVRASEAAEVSLEHRATHATIQANLPDGWHLSVENGSERYILGDHATTLDAGTYRMLLEDAAGKTVPLGDDEIAFEAGCAHHLSHQAGLLGTADTITVTTEPLDARKISLPHSEDEDVFQALDIDAGSWTLVVDGEDLGPLDLGANTSVAGAIQDGTFCEQTVLKPDAHVENLATDAEGHARVDHLAPGTYRIRETDAPEGYIVDDSVQTFTVDDQGLIEGASLHVVPLSNDFTKVDLSKRDAASEQAVVGAELALLDDQVNEIASWTTDEGDHRIERLAAGSYRLVEVLAPRTYDLANTLSITVEETAEPQRFVLYDEPIEVSGEVDKRQEIAEPTRPYAQPDALEADGGSNRAAARMGDDGSFDYFIDMRSTSRIWVDEFTLTDMFDESALASTICTGITTPVATGDFDGKVNVWYATTAGQDSAEEEGSQADEPAANATLQDGHENPWLTHPDTQERLGDDGRVLSYDGWRLWQRDVDLSKATELSVSELTLAEGERIAGIRLEFGRVDDAFTTRSDGWDRDDLKAEHDDVEPAQMQAGQTQEDASGSPLVVHMRATEAYAPSITLVNEAQLDLYRNGGSLVETEKLEDHDRDRVLQRPVAASPTIDTVLTNQADGMHTALPGELDLIDHVELDGLEPGVELTVIGLLRDAETGAPLTDEEGKVVTTSTTISPSAEQEVVDLHYAMDASSFTNTSIVACVQIALASEEDAEQMEQIVAVHEDLDDTDQTVTVQDAAHRLAQTGSLPTAVAFTGLAAVAAGAGIALRRRVRRASR